MNQFAKAIVDIATGEADESAPKRGRPGRRGASWEADVGAAAWDREEGGSAAMEEIACKN